MTPDPDIALLDCVQLDVRTHLLTVRERVTTRGWFFNVTREIAKTYLMDTIGFLDGDRRVVDPYRACRLFDLYFAWKAERALDAYIGARDQARHVLPPVPVMPSR